MLKRNALLALLGSLAFAASIESGCGKRWATLEPAAQASPAPASVVLTRNDPAPSAHALEPSDLEEIQVRSASVDVERAEPTTARDRALRDAGARLVEQCALPALPLPTPKVRASCDPTSVVEHISVYHLTDLHGHWQTGVDGHSPLALIKHFVEKKRLETGGRALFFDGGDDLEKGTIAELRSNGEATLRVIDQLGLDGRTLGNHDFAYGVDSVLRQSNSPAHDVLAGNIRWLPAPQTPDASRTFGGKRWAIYEIGCVRVGVFGLVINPFDETDERIDASYLGVFAQQHDPGDTDRYVQTAAAIVRELRDEQKVDVVIGVNHLGAARDRALIDAIPGLDLVLSGHDHTHITGSVRGLHGVLVNPGSFMRSFNGTTDPRIAEVMLDVDPRNHAARVVTAGTPRIADLGKADERLDADVQRLMRCLAPDADLTVAELANPVSNLSESSWVPILDAALARAFPKASAFLYEAWAYGGIVRGELARGPVTPQQLADFAFVEKQRAGGPGFTAFVGVPVTGAQLLSICRAALRDSPGQRMHRSCPAPATIASDRMYELVLERRPLHAPERVFFSTPIDWPRASDPTSAPVEAWEALLSHAQARGRACKPLDVEGAALCR